MAVCDVDWPLNNDSVGLFVDVDCLLNNNMVYGRPL